MVVRERCGICVESGPVFPVSQTDPLQPGIVILVERIGNQAIVQQIVLHDSWHLCRVPLLHLFSIGVTGCAKLPFGLENARSCLGGNSGGNHGKKEGCQSCPAIEPRELGQVYATSITMLHSPWDLARVEDR